MYKKYSSVHVSSKSLKTKKKKQKCIKNRYNEIHSYSYQNIYYFTVRNTCKNPFFFKFIHYILLYHL